MIISLLRYIRRGRSRYMDPVEIEHLITAKASEQALFAYQQVVGKQIAEDVAEHVTEFAKGFAREGSMEADGSVSSAADALGAVADIIRQSSFPTVPVHIHDRRE